MTLAFILIAAIQAMVITGAIIFYAGYRTGRSSHQNQKQT